MQLFFIAFVVGNFFVNGVKDSFFQCHAGKVVFRFLPNPFAIGTITNIQGKEVSG